MSDLSETLEALFHTTTEGGVAARHAPAQVHPGLLAPATAGEFNTIRLNLSPVACLRLNDIRFEFDSSFVGPKAKEELVLLAQLRKDSPGILGSIFGHADPVGNDAYNKILSGRRAAAVYALLTRRIEIWEDIYKQKGVFTQPLAGDDWGIDAIQIMLATLGHYGGPTHGVLDGPTREAVKAFQRSPPGEGLKDDGDPGPQTRAKLFRAYMDAVCTDAAGKPFQMQTTEFLGGGADAGGKADYQGCSEFNPVLMFSQTENAAFQAAPDKTERNRQNRQNRRVLMFLFRAGTKITPARWPCPRVKEGIAGCQARFYSDHQKRRAFQEKRREFKDTKDTFACRFYDRLAIESPCEVGPPLHINKLRVHLRLRYRDPEPDQPAHEFPAGFSVVVVFADGSEQSLQTGAGGRLAFDVDRGKKSFTLRFESANEQFIASAPPAATEEEKEQLIFVPEVKGFLDRGFRVFNLPLKWSLSDSKWEAPDAPNFRDNSFRDLENVSTSVGSEPAPVDLTLDPRWQFTKFAYFDRRLRKKLSLLPVMLEGFARPSDPAPRTRSNWLTQKEGLQCLPWILLTPPLMPDNQILLRLRAVGGTFIESVGDGTRRLITVTLSGQPDPATLSVADPGLNSGAAQNVDLNSPRAERLRFYDLPAVWKSTNYFTRLAGGGDTLFGKLTDAQLKGSLEFAKPLTFSLDDIVLTDERRRQLPIGAADRVAVFSHKFAATDSAGATQFTPEGVFKPGPHKPDDDVTKTHHPYSEIVMPKPYLITDHPDWTRLVIAQGNLYDAFSERTPDEAANEVVGARAAVRWVNSTGPQPPGTVWVPSGPPQPNVPLTFTPAPDGIPHPGRIIGPRPPRTDPRVIRFFAQQPFYEQRHDAHSVRRPPGKRDEFQTPRPENLTFGIGRFDLAVLRCCDFEDDDPSIEKALSLQYFRFNINFDPTFTAGFDPKAQPAKLTGEAAKNWVESMLESVPKRWNGPDPPHNDGPAQIIPEKTDARKLKVEVKWFVQNVPHRQAHFEIGVFKMPPSSDPAAPNKVRAGMDQVLGRGTFDVSQNGPAPPAVPPAPGGPPPAQDFPAAHESGHGASLGDEYIETAPNMCASYSRAGLISYSPGSPFFLEFPSIMQGGFTIHARYFWHIAEWLRALYGLDFQVNHRTHEFKLEHHPLAPQRSYVNWPLSESIEARIGPRGQFDAFFYPLGRDLYVIPQLANCDGLLAVVLKLRVKTHTTKLIEIQNTIGFLEFGLQGIFNFRIFAKGKVNGKEFKRCLLHVSPRFLVETFSTDKPYPEQTGAKDAAAYERLVTDIQNRNGIHFRVDTRATGTTDWKPTPFEGKQDLRLVMSDPNNINFLGHMLGLPDGGIMTPANFLPVFKTVMTDVELVV